MDFGFIRWLEEQFAEIHKKGVLQMATLQELDAAIEALTTQQTQISTDINTLITAVDALIAKLQSGGDFSSEVAAVSAATAALQGSDTAVTTETTKAQGA